MSNTWRQIMDLKVKDTRCRGIANNLLTDEIETIVATVDYWGGNCQQCFFDLAGARYRVFDWLAMGVQGRIGSKNAAKVLAYSFIKCQGDVDKFIDDLRQTDYEIDRKWEEVKL